MTRADEPASPTDRGIPVHHTASNGESSGSIPSVARWRWSVTIVAVTSRSPPS